jgi:hypothetical protein
MKRRVKKREEKEKKRGEKNLACMKQLPTHGCQAEEPFFLLPSIILFSLFSFTFLLLFLLVRKQKACGTLKLWWFSQQRGSRRSRAAASSMHSEPFGGKNLNKPKKTVV